MASPASAGKPRRNSLTKKDGQPLFVLPEDTESPMRQKLRRAGKVLKPLLESQIFKVLLAGCLFIALFAGGLWCVIDIPDDPGVVVLDVVMILVMLIFILELILNCIVDVENYPLSFFFWMDALGTVSMIFEISFLAGENGRVRKGEGAVDAVLMRIGRLGKVGARLGRLSKLTKVVTIYFRGKDTKVDSNKPAEAKVLSQKLMITLSTKVSLLTLLLVLLTPVFGIGQYPEADLSMQLWADSLETAYKSAYSNGGTAFKEAVEEVKSFYESVNYGVFDIKGFPAEVFDDRISPKRIPGEAVLNGFSTPVRNTNILRIEVRDCTVQRPGCEGSTKAYLDFDFKEPNQIEAGSDIALVCFIILVMFVVSLNLNGILEKMVVIPMERMLNMVKTMASDILKQFGMEDGLDNGQQGDEDMEEETALIEGIFKKFARLATLAAGKNEATAEELAGMDDAAKGVMMDIMNVQVASTGVAEDQSSDSGSDTGSGTSLHHGQVPAVAALPVAKTTIDSWDLDVLTLDMEGISKVALHIFFDSSMGRVAGRQFIDVETFQRFHGVVRSGYNDLPYHNYAHACDVLHTVYRLMTLSQGSKWLSGVEQYSLLVAALCHDLGHAGKTNPFLVEVGDELALRYNDKSPLENMHCAKLFEICGQETQDVFKNMDKDAKKSARRVCIAAILHTDNVNHFEMVRKISTTYETASDLCEVQAANGSDLQQNYQEQVLQKNSMMWMELFLHFADVSNPLKPWNVCFKWAWRVLDEFFDQGDEEKRLGLPVGMLNDRDKINRPGSQHGFINFLVAPLVFSTVKLFPCLHELYSGMARNLGAWKDAWIEDAKPTEEEIAKRDADVQKHKDQALEMDQRFTRTEHG